MEKQYNTDLLSILQHIDPRSLDYQEWLNVGMGLKEAGYTVDDWEAWSLQDPARYHRGECQKKWDSFRGTKSPVTAGTIVKMALDRGWTPPRNEGRELSWDDTIGGKNDLVIINRNWLEGRDVKEPETWNPVEQLVTYLETLFQSTENVGYVTQCWEKDGKYMPSKGCYGRTAGELIQELNQCGGDIGAVLGDYKPEVGAWIRFNPLDGQGVTNNNVTDYRYALVESDNMPIDKQHAIIRELELPVACLVHSGGKSLHAIVRIDANDYREYQNRVDYLYEVCQKNGFTIDRNNRNPSRLSRLPGVVRGNHKQFLAATNIGKSNWAEWQEWIEGVNDDLPEPENMLDVWDHLPELSPPLIDGVLRQGHKMLIAGPSKAGKSYSLIGLCCAIAEGREWLGFRCTQGRVLYVNLELDRASCLHRFKEVYTALGWPPDYLNNIDIWNLRGKSVPMDKLAPKLIRRAAKKDYIAIVIDPIYKVITGDENSADQMAHFCNQFDKVCTELGCAVIYCHHHSKGGQGNKKSMDRASGSGVFARDPDALLDLIELEMSDDLLKQEKNNAVCAVCLDWLTRYKVENEVSQDDRCSASVMLEICREHLKPNSYQLMMLDIDKAKKSVDSRTAWRVEGTLREFPKFSPINIWFDYPTHRIDTVGVLKDSQPDSDQPNWRRNLNKKKTPLDRKKEREQSLETAVQACSFSNETTLKELSEYMGVSEKTARRRIKESGKYDILQNKIVPISRDKIEKDNCP